MKHFFYLLVFCTMLSLQPSFAEDQITIGRDGEQVLEGSVVHVGFREMIIDVEGEKITIDIQDINNKNQVDKYIKTWMNVTVRARMSNGKYEAISVTQRIADDKKIQIQDDLNIK